MITITIIIASYSSKITTIGTITPSISENTVHLKSAYAQTGGTSEKSSMAEHIRNNATTFSTIGQISSMVITVPDSGFNITDAFKVILTGDWNLSVNNGTMTNFGVNFLASPMDGGKPHIHQITNFRPYTDEQPIVLAQGKNLSVNGTADIKINGRIIWDADISVSIYNGNTFSIDPDDNDTENHFGNQRVYGIVTRLF
jgi:hypothetical protein